MKQQIHFALLKIISAFEDYSDKVKSTTKLKNSCWYLSKPSVVKVVKNCKILKVKIILYYIIPFFHHYGPNVTSINEMKKLENKKSAIFKIS